MYIDICGLLCVNKTNVYSFLLCNAFDILQEGEGERECWLVLNAESEPRARWSLVCAGAKYEMKVRCFI